MATRFWRPATTGDWTSTASWSATFNGATGEAAPVNDDDVFLDGTSISVTANHTALSGVVLTSLNVQGPASSGNGGGANGFHGAIGSSGSPLNIGTKLLRITMPTGRIFYSGAVANTGAGRVEVWGTGVGRGAVTLGGSMENVSVSKGDVEITSAATLPTDGAWTFSGGRVYVGDCTMPGSSNAGTVRVGGNAQVELLALPTGTGSSLVVSGNGAYCQYIGADTCPLVDVGGNARLKWQGSVWPTSMVVRSGAVLDLSEMVAGVSSAAITHAEGATIILPQLAVTATFSQTKIGRGATIIGGGLAVVSGLDGVLGGSGGLGV